MMLFHTVNSLVGSRNLAVFNLVKLTSKFFYNSKDSKSALIFLALVIVDFFSNFVIFH